MTLKLLKNHNLNRFFAIITEKASLLPQILAPDKTTEGKTGPILPSSENAADF